MFAGKEERFARIERERGSRVSRTYCQRPMRRADERRQRSGRGVSGSIFVGVLAEGLGGVVV